MFEPCLWTRRVSNQLVGLVLIEVDDLIVSHQEKYRKQFRNEALARFHFEKRKLKEPDLVGTQIRQKEDGSITVDQEKYMLENINIPHLEKKRWRVKGDPLTHQEIKMATVL